jgi:P4 family phage/plasmid primase-like protien
MVTATEIIGQYDAGRKLTPLEYRTKRPVLADWNVRALSRAEVEAAFRVERNVGWVTLGEADVDCDCIEAVRAAAVLAPATGLVFGRQSNPRSHYWYLIGGPEFKRQPFHDPLVVDKDANTLVEFRGKDVQTMAPGSVHPSGERVRFDENGQPATIAAGDLLWAVKRIAAAAILGRYWNPGSRHEATLALVGWLGRYWERADVERFVEAVHAAGADDEARGADLASTFARLAAGEPVTGLPKLRGLLPTQAVEAVAVWLGLDVPDKNGNVFSEDDLGNAERLRSRLGPVRHITMFGKFHLCENGIWLRDETNTVAAAALDVARELRDLAAVRMRVDERDGKAAIRHAVHAASASGTTAMLTQLSRLDGVRAGYDIWDTHPDLLPVRNGVVDLRTAKLLPHDPGYFFTRFVDFDYEPGAEDWDYTRAWREYLDTTFVDEDGNTDDELIFYVQRWMGYCLCGLTREQVFAVLYGQSGSGKGVMERMMLHLMPRYCTTINPAALLEGGESRHATELAGLFGARSVISSEVAAGQRIATAQIKRLTGQDLIKARFMRQDEFAFMPTFKLMMLANERFMVDEDSDGLWRRMHVIEFFRRFRDIGPHDEVGPLLQPKDYTLEPRIFAEAEGVLAWMIQGAAMWYECGLDPPQRVKDATLRYRRSQDVLVDFVRARLMPVDDPAGWATAMAVFEEWNSYRFKAREDEISVRAFKAKMAARGYRSEMRGDVEYLVGLAVRLG